MPPFVIILGLAGLFLIIGAGAAIVLGGKNDVENRLEEYVGGTAVDIPEAEIVTSDGPDVADRLDTALSGRNFFEPTRQKISKADVKLRVSEYMVLVVISGVVGGIAGYFLFLCLRH